MTFIIASRILVKVDPTNYAIVCGPTFAVPSMLINPLYIHEISFKTVEYIFWIAN